jgi:hypothetical protein
MNGLFIDCNGSVASYGWSVFTSCSGLLDRDTKIRPKYPRHKRAIPMAVKIAIESIPIQKL